MTLTRSGELVVRLLGSCLERRTRVGMIIRENGSWIGGKAGIWIKYGRNEPSKSPLIQDNHQD